MRNGYRLDVRIPQGRQDPNLERYPALYYHEVVEWEITRVIAIWVDGHTGIARSKDMLELGGCFVPDQPDPEPEPTIDWPVVDLSAEQFERFWEAALQRVERETGIIVER